MSARLLLLCPGQGGQHPGMNAMAAADPAAARLLAQAPLPDGSLFDNKVAQPAVVASTLAMWLALAPRLAALPLPLRPALVAGYSVGELAAYAVAGALTPAETIALAHQRAAVMDQASDREQGLAAISGIAIDQLAALARTAACEIAIVNGADSAVVGGSTAQLPRLRTLAEARGARVQVLPVAVAAHTSLLSAAVGPFAQALAAAPFGQLACPVLAGVDGAPVLTRGAAIAALSRQLAQTIRWADCMDAALENGITVALELGPGPALSKMLQNRHPGIACRSVAEFRSLDGVVSWIGRQLV
jgi:[acyl-carrier-protein] S-malonyltransferase